VKACAYECITRRFGGLLNTAANANYALSQISSFEKLYYNTRAVV